MSDKIDATVIGFGLTCQVTFVKCCFTLNEVTGKN